jgi:hypothetical protein
MSPKSSSVSKKEKRIKIESSAANSFRVISRKVNIEEANKPVYLLRYDD